MKKIKIKNNIVLNDFNVSVNPYLTYAQIQYIVNEVCKFDSWAERQQNIDLLLLHYVTDITDEEINEYGHELLLQSGLIDAVKKNVSNLKQIYKAIDYTQSTQRMFQQILKEMPKYINSIKEVGLNGIKRKE